ncbi:hypothetical protein FXF51_25810 [Nonomuraea sp. PA05]|uniref:hypothetical protein n=1 Tax=Nonomuraea sp. PA05 TaxID=2604466 RepID=UPI0011D46142|nr:hypothetical protein [Nonomuraea sp. PA05]TYB62830.1 hypothetical protein FXF51_25810 [Nonomuraea sp. PA05]
MHSAEVFRSIRLVLRQRGEQQADAVAAELSWARSAARGGDGETYEAIWAVDGNTTFRYVEDVTSGEALCQLLGSAREPVAEALRQIESRLDAWTQRELLEAVKAASTPYEMVQALFRLSLGAPITLDDTHLGTLSLRFGAAIDEAVRHEHPMVRAAAVRATAYMEWPVLRLIVQEVAERDSDSRVAKEANLVLQAFDLLDRHR